MNPSKASSTLGTACIERYKPLWLSKEERREDALALRAEEGRDKLR